MGGVRRLQGEEGIAAGIRVLDGGLWGGAVGLWIATVVRISNVRRRRQILPMAFSLRLS